MPHDMQHITANILPSGVRHEMLEGRDHLVAPMVMMVEGVANGSNGPLHYPGDELERSVDIWNHKPVVVYHPQKNGKGVSACSPDILNTQKVGTILNTKYDGNRLKAEAWIDVSLVDKVDPRITAAMEKGTVMELSTGLFTDNETIEGEFNGKQYEAIARNYRPDHLALLPDRVGACSVADGAGFLRLNERHLTLNAMDRVSSKVSEIIENELSHSELREQLRGLITTGKDEYCYIEDVFDSYFIYEKGGKYYKQEYSVKDEIVKLSGVPTLVTRDTNWVSVNNQDSPIKENETMKFDQKAFIDKLIANEKSPFEEDDREMLSGLSEDKLKKMEPVEVVKEVVKEVPAANEQKEDPAPTTNETKTDPPKKASVTEYVSNAPPEIREVLNHGLATHLAEKAKLVKVITSNKKNTFTEEQLKGKDITELQQLAALAQPEAPTKRPALYAGDGGISENELVDNDVVVNEEDDVPVIDWDKELSRTA